MKYVPKFMLLPPPYGGGVLRVITNVGFLTQLAVCVEAKKVGLTRPGNLFFTFAVSLLDYPNCDLCVFSAMPLFSYHTPIKPCFASWL